MYDNGICANCECDVNEDCCGEGKPFVMDDIAYCCQGCAEDGECECGCIIATVAPTEGQSAGALGPII
jgi:hypothetical protein